MKQIQTGLAVTGDGAVPVFHRGYDGGAGEVSQVVAAMRACQQLAGPRRFLLVGDSKLVSYSNLRDMIEAGVDFIAPASKSYVTALFVHSTARAGAAATARAKKLDRARDDLQRLGRGLASRHYPDAAAVAARIATITRERRVGAYLRTEVGTDSVTGKPTLSWSFDADAVAAEAATDGWYALLTNLPADIGGAEVLRRYKGQEAVERRYGAFKGPLAVAPMFLHNNRRIAALITVICLALLVFCLVERAVRLAIAPATKLDGLQAGRSAKPTGQLIFGALAGMRLIPATAGQPAIIPRPGPLQTRLLHLLDVDPTTPP